MRAVSLPFSNCTAPRANPKRLFGEAAVCGVACRWFDSEDNAWSCNFILLDKAKGDLEREQRTEFIQDLMAPRRTVR